MSSSMSRFFSRAQVTNSPNKIWPFPSLWRKENWKLIHQWCKFFKVDFFGWTLSLFWGAWPDVSGPKLSFPEYRRHHWPGHPIQNQTSVAKQKVLKIGHQSWKWQISAEKSLQDNSRHMWLRLQQMMMCLLPVHFLKLRSHIVNGADPLNLINNESNHNHQ